MKSWIQTIEDRTAEDYKKFFREFGTFAELFGEELTLKHLMANVQFFSLVKETYFRSPNKWADEHGEYLGTKPHEFEEWKGRWVRKVRDTAYVYLMPSDYQNTKHADIIRPILAELYPWTNDFKLYVFSIRGGESPHNAQMYVQLEATIFGRCSLYVPYKYLVAGDAEAIRQHNRAYFDDYYGRRAKKDERFATYTDTVLNDPVTKRFLERVERR